MEGDSSKLMEVEEPMEESPAVATSSLTKRKADSDPEEEEEEYLDSEDEEEEEYLDSEDEDEEEYVDEDELLKPKYWWTAPEWDVDSYDGLQYDSGAEEKHPLTDPVEKENWRRFKRLVIESKGFYVDSSLTPDFCYVGIVAVDDLDMPAGHGRTYREYFEHLTRLCLQRYNDENSQKNGFIVEFDKVVRGNYTVGSRSKSYITFLAREKSDGPLVEYQAKGWSTFKKGEDYPILCRRAPPSSFPNQ